MQRTEQSATVDGFDQGLKVIACWLRDELEKFRSAADFGNYGTILIEVDVQKGEIKKLRLRKDLTVHLPLPPTLP